MSKFIGIIVGAVELIAGIVLEVIPGGQVFGALLISAGIGTLISGAGTLITGAINGNGSAQGGGITTASRNPIAPWNVVYGRSCVGGTIVFLNEWGDMNKYLDIVIVLACHPCHSVDWLLMDKQMIQLNSGGGAWNGVSGDSFGPAQQVVSISHIVRSNNVVTCTLEANIPYAVPGVYLKIQGITGDRTLNGRYPIASIVSQIAGSPGSLVFTYICGGIASIVDLEGQAVTQWPEYGQKIHMEALTGTHTATFPGMLTGTPNDGDTGDLIINADNPWNDSCKLLGRTSVFLRLHYDAATWAGGLPTISFLVHGKYDIFDPRLGSYGASGSTAYTENAALIIADYLNNTTWGFKATYGTEIPSAPLIAAANICDESVTLAAGGSEPRWACNGQFTLNVKRGEILQNLLTSCSGRITYTSGQFIIWPAAWYGSTIGSAPTMGQMAGPFQWRPTISIRDLFNGVKGTYISPANNYEASDIPPYAQDTLHGYTASGAAAWSSSTAYSPGDETTYLDIGYVCISTNTNQEPDTHPGSWVVHYQDQNLTADGGDRRWKEIQLPFTISPGQAQRSAKIDLLRGRRFGTGTFRYNMAGYAMTTLDVIQMNLPFFNWTNKQLEVTAHRFTLAEQDQDGTSVTLLGTEIDVQETDSSDYDWSPTEELTAQGYQQLTLPGAYTPAPPTNLILQSNYSTAVELNGALQDVILVSWTAPADGYVLNGGHIEIQYQPYVAPVTAGTVSITTGGAVTFTSPVLITGFDQALLIIGSDIYTIETITSTTTGTVSPNPTTAVSGATFALASQTGVWTGLPSVQPTVTQVPINGVVDGQEYTVEIRSVNAADIPSAWVSGQVTAFGARAPLPWQPNAQVPLTTDVVSQNHNFRLNLNYGTPDSNVNYNPLLNLSGYEPINTTGISPAPGVSSITYVISAGGAIAAGTYEFCLCALDNVTPATSLGISEMSDTITVVVPSSGSQITFSGFTFGVNYGGYFLFGGGGGLPSFVPQTGAVFTTPPTSITIGAVSTIRAGQPPDLEYDHNHTQAFVVQHAGVWDAQTTSNIPASGAGSGGPGTVIALPACVGFSVNQFAGYILELQPSNYADGSPAPIARSLITSHDAAGNFTIDATGWVMAAGDNVLCRMKVTPVGTNGFSDANITNAIYPTGNATNASKGAEVWVIDQDVIQQIRVVIANDANSYTIDGVFYPALTTNSQVIIVYPTAIYDYVGSSRIITAGSNNSGQSLVAQIPVTNYVGQILVVRSYAESVNLAVNPFDCPVRMAWIAGKAGGGLLPSAGYYTITPDANGNFPVDLANGLNQRIILTSTAQGLSLPVLDPGFETALAGNWTVTGTAAISAAAAHSGAQSLLTSATSSYVYQVVAGVTTGVVYSVSAWVFAATGTSVVIKADDGAGSNLVTSATVTGGSTLAWQRIIVFYTGSATGNIGITLEQTSAGSAYFDDVLVGGSFVLNPVFTGGTIAPGLSFTFYEDQDATGSHLGADFGTAFASDVPQQGVDPTASTRSTFIFTWHGTAWGLDSFRPSGAIS